jgi:hypothetical protein
MHAAAPGTVCNHLHFCRRSRNHVRECWHSRKVQAAHTHLSTLSLPGSHGGPPDAVCVSRDHQALPSVSCAAQAARRNPNILSVLTSHGGHLGWVCGWRRQWMCPAIADFLLAVNSTLDEDAHARKRMATNAGAVAARAVAANGDGGAAARTANRMANREGAAAQTGAANVKGGAAARPAERSAAHRDNGDLAEHTERCHEIGSGARTQVGAAGEREHAGDGAEAAASRRQAGAVAGSEHEQSMPTTERHEAGAQ